MDQPEQNAGRHDLPDDCCGRCAAEQDLPDDPRALRGWRLAAGSCAVFIGPVILAALGARRLGPSGAGQTFGALVGLVAGAMLARWVLARIGPRTADDS